MLARLIEWYLSIFGPSSEPQLHSNEALKNWLLCNPDKTIDDFLLNTNTNYGDSQKNTNDAPSNLEQNN